MQVKHTSHSVNLLNEGAFQRIILQNNDITVELTNIGASIVALHTRDKYGVQKNVVAGFKDLSRYTSNSHYLGCVVGRCANRIAEGKFEMNGQEYQLTINDAPNHLHGGQHGFHHKVWKVDTYAATEIDCKVTFSCFSRDQEEGYPGNVHATVEYTLHKNQLVIQFTATTDQATPVNLTNHSYFNLTGFETPTIYDHVLQINADHYTEKSDANTATGKILEVAGTELDFRQPAAIGKGINGFPADMGYDHNYVLRSKGELAIAAVLSAPDSGRSLTIITDKPGIQVYSANYFDGITMGTHGKPYIKHGAVALETQLFPDSVNHSNFPNSILQPDATYDYTTIFQFDVI